MIFRSLFLIFVVLSYNISANAKTPTLTNKFGSKWVFETKQERCLSFLPPPTNVVQSCMNLKEPAKLVFGYTKMFFSSLYINPNPSKILLIGLGGGSVPKALVKIMPDVKIDIVEIDPDIVVLAEKHFQFKISKTVNVFVEDGFEFVKNSASKKYDIILIDAFTEDYIPPNFLTMEFVDNIKRILTDKGIIAINTFGKRNNKFYDQETSLYEQAFTNIINLNDGNRVILASKTHLPNQLEISRNALTLQKDFIEIGINKDWLLKLLGVTDPQILWLLKPKNSVFKID